MMSTRVLHVMGRMNRGGAELRLIELLERLPRGEFSVDVCSLSGLKGHLDARIEALGGEVILLAIDARFPGRFVRLLRDRHYGVVHTHVLYASGLILALAALAQVPVRIAHFHAMADGGGFTIRRRLQRWTTKHLLDAAATDIIACGEGSMDAVWPHWRGDSRCRVVYDAIDSGRFRVPIERVAARTAIGVPASAPLFIHIGDGAAEKNHPRLLRVFAAIRDCEPSARLVLAGAGTEQPDGRIAQLIRDTGLQEHVLALGDRDDVPHLLAAADTLLLPSLREGLPGVVLEACAAGIPVLATDLPGVREIAVRLPGVSYLPLSLADEQWAHRALALALSAGRATRGVLSQPDPLRGTVFDLDRAVEAHRVLWTRRIASGADPAVAELV